MEKRMFSTELCYILGIILLAFGATCMAKADLGLSMVVAPAYLLHLKLGITFGTAEYCLQAVLLLFMLLLLRRFKLTYLLSFLTAVIYGAVLDGFMLIIEFPALSLMARIALFSVGLFSSAAALAFFFKSYLTPLVYELFVREISQKIHVPLSHFKTYFDLVFCVLAIMLSFAFFGFGKFEGVKIGTVVCTLLNGWLIGRYTESFDKKFVFRDACPWRKNFE
ncbi:MAG: hypothetical protein E7442_02625 [Ruminococcaceae bacterium]|nr:hypothetical protein [Oscillospiraceae bacterium]